MNYKEINDKWKVFLTENAFKEDIVIKPEKDKKKKKKKIIVSEKDDCMEEGSKCMDEWEELEETSGAGAVAGYALPLGSEKD